MTKLKIRFYVFMFNLIFTFQKVLRKTVGYKGYWCEHSKNLIACDRINLVKYAYKYFSKLSVSRPARKDSEYITTFKIELMPYGQASIHSSNCGYMGFRDQKDIIKVINL